MNEADRPTPPELWIENQLHYRAFWDLHPERVQVATMVGMVPGVIPRSTVQAYADSEGLDFQELAKDLRAMDGAYLDFVGEQRKAEEEKRKREAEVKRREAPNVHRGRR